MRGYNNLSAPDYESTPFLRMESESLRFVLIHVWNSGPKDLSLCPDFSYFGPYIVN